MGSKSQSEKLSTAGGALDTAGSIVGKIPIFGQIFGGILGAAGGGLKKGAEVSAEKEAERAEQKAQSEGQRKALSGTAGGDPQRAAGGAPVTPPSVPAPGALGAQGTGVSATSVGGGANFRTGYGPKIDVLNPIQQEVGQEVAGVLANSQRGEQGGFFS